MDCSTCNEHDPRSALPGVGGVGRSSERGSFVALGTRWGEVGPSGAGRDAVCERERTGRNVRRVLVGDLVASLRARSGRVSRSFARTTRSGAQP